MWVSNICTCCCVYLCTFSLQLDMFEVWYCLGSGHLINIGVGGTESYIWSKIKFWICTETDHCFIYICCMCPYSVGYHFWILQYIYFFIRVLLLYTMYLFYKKLYIQKSEKYELYPLVMQIRLTEINFLFLWEIDLFQKIPPNKIECLFL